MRLKVFAVCLAILFILGWLVLFPVPLKEERSLDIQLTEVGQNAEGLPRVIAVLSNASGNVLLYDNGPLMEVASLRNGAWHTNFTPRSVTGHTLLQPGMADRPIELSGEVVPGAEAVRVGLSFTSFSWRGRLALRIPDSHLLRPIASALFALDKSKRSGDARSDSLVLNSSKTTRRIQ